MKKHLVKLQDWGLAHVRQARADAWIKANADLISYPQQKFIIFGRGRSGSTFLADLLNSLPNVCCDDEILNIEFTDPLAYVKYSMAKSANSTYGFKLLNYQLRRIEKRSGFEDFLTRLVEEWGFQIIYLSREDKLARALSNIRARKFGFHTKGKPKESPKKIVVGRDLLMKRLAGNRSNEIYVQNVLSTRKFLQVSYERDLADPDAIQAMIHRVCDYLEIPRAPAQSNYKKISPAKLSDSIENYDEILEWIQASEFSDILTTSNSGQ